MYHIIVNPASRSGRGMQIWNTLLPILLERKVPYKAYFTKECGHATFIADRICAMSPTVQGLRMIVLGGDGTLNEVIQGIHDYEHTVIGYIPTGSSNDFARAMGISSEPSIALKHILNRHTVASLNLGLLSYKKGQLLSEHTSVIGTSAERRLFCVSSGIGFDAAVCEQALSSTMKTTFNRVGLGKLTYLGIALTNLLQAKEISCDIYLDDKEPIHYNSLLFAAAMIHKYEGGGFMLCPQADATDDLLDICIVHDISLQRALRILPTAFQGKHIRYPEVTIHRAHTIRLCCDSPLPVHTDGEVNVHSSELIFTTAKHRINFIY